MTTRIGSRLALSQFAWTVAAETRLAARAVPGVLRVLTPIVAWAAIAIGLGTVVGFAVVILPPLGAFGIVAAVGLVLLWVMPEVPLVYPAAIRKTFFVMLVTLLCVPYYYMVQFGDLPWISARRVATFSLIAPFLLALAGSSAVRARIADRARSSPAIIICTVGYLVMAVLSIPQSPLPGVSLSALTEAVLSWYLPFFAMMYLVHDKDDSILILKVMCFCALFNTLGGVVEFYLQHRYFVDLIPKSMLNAAIESNPVLEVVLDVNGNNFRNGLYRASSTFLVALSFGEFEAILIPIGLFFAVHRQDYLERFIGWVVVIGGFIGIFVSGSRGAYLGFLVSTASFVVMWSIRKAMDHRGSLAPALVGLTGVISFVVVVGLIFFGRRPTTLSSAAGRRRPARKGDGINGRRRFR